MTFVEVTVGTEKLVLNVGMIERVVPAGDGASIGLRGTAKGKLSFVHVEESYEDLTQILDSAGAKILRLTIKA